MQIKNQKDDIKVMDSMHWVTKSDRRSKLYRAGATNNTAYNKRVDKISDHEACWLCSRFGTRGCKMEKCERLKRMEGRE